MLSKKEAFSRAEEVLDILCEYYPENKTNNICPYVLAICIVNYDVGRFLTYLSARLNEEHLNIVSILETEYVWQNLFE